MRNKKKISIVTPTFNQGQYIEQTIESVLDQNYPNLEYIVIDGGSTDDTVEIIRKYERHLNYWISEPDYGQAHAINKGLHYCTGEIFNWLNSDDYLAQDALNNIAEAFEISNADAVAGQTIYFDEKVVQEPEQLANLTARNIMMWRPGTIFVQPGLWLKRDLIVKCGGINDIYHYCFDWDLVIRYLDKFENVQYINQKLVYFRLHEESKTISCRAKFNEEQLDIINQYVNNSDSLILGKIAREKKNRNDLYEEVKCYTKPSDGIILLFKLIYNPSKYFNRITLGKIRQLFS